MNGNQPHVLYRFYGASGDLLYIGITVNLGSRLSGHGDKPWIGDVATIRIENHPDRATALDAEREAIIAESPRHNIRITHTSGRLRAPAQLLHLPDEVLAVRVRAGLTQRQAAEQLFISPSLLSEIEKGTRSASIRILKRMAGLYGCPVVQLERPQWWVKVRKTA